MSSGIRFFCYTVGKKQTASVNEEGRGVTYDMKPTRDDPTAVGTSEVADAVIEKLGG